MSEPTPPLSTGQDLDAERLSALLDGELDAEAIAPLSAAWGRDAGLREQWQTYGLIGDVLRTGAPTGSSSRDQQLFEAIRARLADEPVVLAPQPRPSAPLEASGQVIALPATAAATGRRLRWRRHGIPAAGIAAGLAFVGVMAWKLPQPGDAGGARELASSPASTISTVAAVDTPALPSSAAGPVTDGTVTASTLPMRPYLQAHRAMTAGYAIDPGPGQLRRVAQEQVAR